MKVLVVEDDPQTVETIELCFSIRWPDATVQATQKGGSAVSMVEADRPDLVLLDLGLPDLDGLTVLKDIRSVSDVPVIVVTARSEEVSRIKGLEIGADDYIVKPFSHTELLARAKAVLRRSGMQAMRDDAGTVRGKGFTIEGGNRRVVVAGREVYLTPVEANMLGHLSHNEGKVVAAEALKEKVWGSGDIADSALKACIRRLRLKIERDPHSPQIILSHRGKGYVFYLPR